MTFLTVNWESELWSLSFSLLSQTLVFLSFDSPPLFYSVPESARDQFRHVFIHSFVIWALVILIYLFFPLPPLSFFLSFSFLIPFDHSLLKSHRFDPVESDPFFHWLSERYEIWLIFRSKVLMLCEILGFLLFLYPYPAGTVFESLENLFFPYESILLHSNSFPPYLFRIGS